MLKSNSKEEIERIKEYVCDNVIFDTVTVNDLGDILELTAMQRYKYSESEAEER